MEWYKLGLLILEPGLRFLRRYKDIRMDLFIRSGLGTIKDQFDSNVYAELRD